MAKRTFGEWAVRLRTKPSPASIIVSYQGKDKCQIDTNDFEESGFHTFPTDLQMLIINELQYGNIYDKFVDSFYEWLDNE